MNIPVELQTALAGILSAMLVTIVGALSQALFAWLKKKVALLEAQLQSEHLELLKKFAAVAVKAAEQAGLKGIIKDEAAAKRAYAINVIQSFLAKNNLSWIPVEQIAAALEAALREGLHKNAPIIEAVELDLSAINPK